MRVGQHFVEASRRYYGSLLSMMARTVARSGIHPNTLTILSLLPAAAAGVAAAQGAFFAAAALLLASGALDLLDGALARETGQATRFGALLDSTLDRLSDAAVPAGLVVLYAPSGGYVIVPVLVIMSGFIISYVRARAEGLAIDLPRLWMRREDRLVTVVVALLLAPIPIEGAAIPAPLMLLVLAALALLGFVAATMALLAAARRA